MAVAISPIKRKENTPLAPMLGATGAVIGGIAGTLAAPGPGTLAGLSAGASLGAMAGGTAGSVIDVARKKDPGANPVGLGESISAIDRRLGQMKQSNPQQQTLQLEESIKSLPYVDPQQRQEAAPVLTQAYLASLNKQYLG